MMNQPRQHDDLHGQHSPESADASNEQLILGKLTRRQFAIVTLIAVTLGVAAEEVIRRGWYVPNLNGQDRNNGEHDEHGENPEVIARLVENARALREIEETSLYAVMEQQQKRDPILVPRPPNLKKKCCIDERYKEEGTGEGLAGVGVLLSDAELQAQAAIEVDEMEAALETQDSYTLEICPHGAGKCGAAKLARVQAGEKDMTPEAIDRTALQGGERFRDAVLAEIRRRPKLNGKRIAVIVRMLPEEHFLQAHHHPAAIGMHNAEEDTIMNLDRQTGPLMFNIKSVADGLLAAKIALGDHGMEHGPQSVHLPPGIPFRIVLRGDPDVVRALGREYQRQLALPDNRAIRGRVLVQTWPVRA